MFARMRSFVRDDSGVSFVEYAILASLIAAVCVGVVTTLGTSVRGLYTTLGGKF